MKDSLTDLNQEYKVISDEIERRIGEFKSLWYSKDHILIFKEFVFCLLTPQSKAKFCWESVLNLEKKKVLFDGSFEDIYKELLKVRFRKNKARYIIENRERFLNGKRFKLVEIIEEIKDPFKVRDFLFKNIKGYGLKEASHFLRNIGFSFELAILDRHILKNLYKEGVISEIPENLSRKKYFEIEYKFKEFSQKVGIPLQNLDLFFWWRETGEVFK